MARLRPRSYFRGMIEFYYSDVFNIPLPVGHRFPGDKYRLLREALLADGVVRADALSVSPLAAYGDLVAMHTQSYVDALFSGEVSTADIRRIGLPWSTHLVQRSQATVGGALAASRSSLRTGFSAQLAGGTHHAHADFGSGYCVFNDLAIVAHQTIADGLAERVAIIDLDVHQGDGNAALLNQRKDIFILDLYCEKNFPFRKVEPHLGCALQAGTDDDAYLRVLHAMLPAVFAFRPDIVLYQAGVDPLRHDKLGHLDLSYEGLAARDRMVFAECRSRGIPVSLAIGGGYSDPIGASVRAYANTFRVAKSVYGF